jgi:hypothetical protein
MKLGLFFGAGAEMAYGLPSGGKFAIELFRLDPTDEKQKLRGELQQINRFTSYATKWLPDKFWSKNLHAFGKSEFSSLIESSIENKKHRLIQRLGEFDTLAEAQFAKLQFDEAALKAAYRAEFDKELGTEVYSQVIRLNSMLGEHGQIFGSRYYSALLDVIRARPEATLLKRFAVSFLQLLVGSCGHDLISRLNQEIFSEAPDDLPIFDDVAGLFRVEMSKGGLDAIDLLITERTDFNAIQNPSLVKMLCAVARGVLEALFDGILDYQALIDNHFRYLFSPKTEWAKFTKMVIFMRLARTYIVSQMPADDALPDEGYYHDLAKASDWEIELEAIGTSNYNSLLERFAVELGFDLPEIFYLNGGVSDFYNPYTNDVVSVDDHEEVPGDQLHVPFILTQSGLKPLTSVSMSRRYVELFDKFTQCDALAVVGFGFNTDDSHINGLFRKLVDEHGKPLFWVRPGNNQTMDQIKSELLEKLRLPEARRSQIHPVIVNRETREAEEDLWLKAIADEYPLS